MCGPAAGELLITEIIQNPKAAADLIGEWIEVQNIGSQDGSLPVAYAPSGAPNERFHVMPRVLSREMIADIVPPFGSVNMIGGELDR